LTLLAQVFESIDGGLFFESGAGLVHVGGELDLDAPEFELQLRHVVLVQRLRVLQRLVVLVEQRLVQVRQRLRVLHLQVVESYFRQQVSTELLNEERLLCEVLYDLVRQAGD